MAHIVHVTFQMFPDAEKAFTQVLKLDKNCEDAVQELLRVRTHQIMVSMDGSSFKPFLTNEFSHHYHLDESTFIFRGMWSSFQFLFTFSMNFL